MVYSREGMLKRLVAWRLGASAQAGTPCRLRLAAGTPLMEEEACRAERRSLISGSEPPASLATTAELEVNRDRDEILKDNQRTGCWEAQHASTRSRTPPCPRPRPRLPAESPVPNRAGAKLGGVERTAAHHRGPMRRRRKRVDMLRRSDWPAARPADGGQSAVNSCW